MKPQTFCPSHRILSCWFHPLPPIVWTYSEEFREQLTTSFQGFSHLSPATTYDNLRRTGDGLKAGLKACPLCLLPGSCLLPNSICCLCTVAEGPRLSDSTTSACTTEACSSTLSAHWPAFLLETKADDLNHHMVSPTNLIMTFPHPGLQAWPHPFSALKGPWGFWLKEQVRAVRPDSKLFEETPLTCLPTAHNLGSPEISKTQTLETTEIPYPLRHLQFKTSPGLSLFPKFS